MRNNPQTAQALREKIELAKRWFPNGAPRPGVLRQEIAVSNTTNQYVFDFNENVAGGATESKLAITDAFFVTHIGFHLLVEDQRKPGSGQLLTYPNEAALAAAYGITLPNAVPAADDLESFYAGRLALKVDDQIEFDRWSMRAHRFVGEVQQSAINARNAQTYFDGLVAIEPNPVLNGARRNQFTLSVPNYNGVAPTWAATDANIKVKAALSLHGLHVPGGANLYKKA